MTTGKTVLSLCAFVHATGCSGDRSVTAAASPVIPDGGHARISVGQIDALPHIAAVEDMRIDGYEAALVSVEWLGISSDGTIAVLQPQEFSMRYFDADGAALGSFGREGSGPGEFRRPIRAGPVGDSLWIGDPLLNRITIVSPARELTRTLLGPTDLLPPGAPATETSPYTSSYPLAFYPGDTLLLSAFHRPDDRTELLRTSADGTISRAALVLPKPPMSSITVEVGTRMLFLRPPYMPRILTDAAPDGRAIAMVTTEMDSSTYMLLVIDPAGDTLFTRNVAFRGEPVPQDSLDRKLEEQLARVSGAAQRIAAKHQLSPLMPEFYPPVTALMLDRMGRTWVGLRHTSEGSPWILFSERGRPLGTIMFPPRSRLLAANADAAYVVELDQLDVESIVRYAIQVPDL